MSQRGGRGNQRGRGRGNPPPSQQSTSQPTKTNNTQPSTQNNQNQPTQTPQSQPVPKTQTSSTTSNPPVKGVWGKSTQAPPQKQTTPSSPPPVQTSTSPQPAAQNVNDNNNAENITQQMTQLTVSSFSPKHDDDVAVIQRPTSAQKQYTGRVIKIYSNNFPFDIKTQVIYQHVVNFEPHIESRSRKRKILSELKTELGEFTFDGNMLWLTKKLLGADLQTSLKDTPYRVTIQFTKELHPGDHAALQHFNITLKQILRNLKLKQIGRQHFDPSRSKPIPQHFVEVWPGYFTSVIPCEVGTFLSVDVTHKILRTETVLDYLNNLMQDNPRNWKEAANQNLLGAVVMTRYNNRTYRIDSIEWGMNPTNKFSKRTGQEHTYMEYYALAYNKKISEPNQPLLLHIHHRKGAEDERIYLIPELCTMTGLTNEMRKDFRVMKDISEHTRVNPQQRAEEIQSFIESASAVPEVKQSLATWGMTLGTEMLSTEGRILPPEILLLGNNKQLKVDPEKGEWGRELRGAIVSTPIALKNWVLVYFFKNTQQADDLYNNLQRSGKNLGISFEQPRFVELRDDRKTAFVDAIKSNVDENTQLVVCLVPQETKDRYDAIKQLCCLELPIPSQVVKAKSMNKNVGSICDNILRQINCKLGGDLWRADIPLGKAMIVGIDVYHDTKTKERSVAGFCASMNQYFTKYFSLCPFQKTGQELVDGLKGCMTEALRQFFDRNAFLPDKIIVYRDGVGDGQLDAVVQHEIPQLIEAFETNFPNYHPKLGFIIVKKRINTRLFTKAGNVLRNPPPGTVVDTALVHKNWYDFYLVPQYVTQGTVTPTHYHVVYDTTGLEPDHIQKLSYKLCHLYFNWAGTIRVPAPCQYAHKVAYLAGQSLHQAVMSPKLLSNLYFL